MMSVLEKLERAKTQPHGVNSRESWRLLLSNAETDINNGRGQKWTSEVTVTLL